MANIDTIQQAFLSAFARHGVIGPAAKEAGTTRRQVLDWRDDDEEFDEACDDAYECSVDDAELELRTRAVEGVAEVVTYKGEPVWMRNPDTGEVELDDDFNPKPFTVLKKSDSLLALYSKANREKYNDKTTLEHVGKGGKALTPVINVNYVLPEGMTPEDYEQDDNGGED